LDKIDTRLLAIAQNARTFMDLKVAEKIGLPASYKKGKDQDPNSLLKPATEAYKRLMPHLPAMSQMDAGKRRERLVQAVTVERSKAEKAQGKQFKPLRPSSLWDKPTKEESEKARERFGGFMKIPTPWKTGFRLKEGNL
jgi:hypothetical protein